MLKKTVQRDHIHLLTHLYEMFNKHYHNKVFHFEDNELLQTWQKHAMINHENSRPHFMDKYWTYVCVILY